jgi:hypothetical protein
VAIVVDIDELLNQLAPNDDRYCWYDVGHMDTPDSRPAATSSDYVFTSFGCSSDLTSETLEHTFMTQNVDTFILPNLSERLPLLVL